VDLHHLLLAGLPAHSLQGSRFALPGAKIEGLLSLKADISQAQSRAWRHHSRPRRMAE
jgi:hypothetical protein